MNAKDLGAERARVADDAPSVARPEAARRRGPLRKALPWLLRSAGLLVLVALSFLGVDVIGGFELMFEANPGYLTAAFFVFCGALLAQMTVWTSVARSLNLGYRRLRSYVRVFLVGWAAGLGMPRGAVPVARAAILAADKRSVGRGVVVDIADRLLQVTTFLILLVVSAAYLSFESAQVLRGVGFSLAVLAMGGMIALGAWRFLGPLLHRLSKPAWLESFLSDMGNALRELRQTSPKALAAFLAVSLVASVLSVTALFLTSRAIDVHLSYPAVTAAFAAVSLTVVLPISINGLGPREGILTAAVAGAGFSSEAGVALGLLWFVIQGVTRLVAATSWFISSAELPENASG